MTDIDPLAAHACETLLVGSYSLMDRGLYAESAALFARDATWVRGGKPFTGREAILAALHQRPPSALTRHVISNVLVTSASPGEAEAHATFFPLRGTAREDGTAPMPKMEMFGDITARFRREDDAWLITWLEPKPVFRG